MCGGNKLGFKIVYSKKAAKDAEKIIQAGLKDTVLDLIEALKDNTFNPPYEKLIGDLQGAYSRRINIQHRLVYEVLSEKKIVKILRMWSHYEK